MMPCNCKDSSGNCICCNRQVCVEDKMRMTWRMPCPTFARFATFEAFEIVELGVSLQVHVCVALYVSRRVWQNKYMPCGTHISDIGVDCLYMGNECCTVVCNTTRASMNNTCEGHEVPDPYVYVYKQPTPSPLALSIPK